MIAEGACLHKAWMLSIPMGALEKHGWWQTGWQASVPTVSSSRLTDAAATGIARAAALQAVVVPCAGRVLRGLQIMASAKGHRRRASEH